LAKTAKTSRFDLHKIAKQIIISNTPSIFLTWLFKHKINIITMVVKDI